eukprot:TRINITY_DN666_c0_g1_i2.p1 TRINITY_DN666_c0_g1~~TRINITY_DN666_c0_g1_i2.p1  ORF type:complete len:123 (-),score=0.33 TRINITY_DN666_c0_g1_i2:189-557(-)
MCFYNSFEEDGKRDVLQLFRGRWEENNSASRVSARVVICKFEGFLQEIQISRIIFGHHKRVSTHHNKIKIFTNAGHLSPTTKTPAMWLHGILARWLGGGSWVAGVCSGGYEKDGFNSKRSNQ